MPRKKSLSKKTVKKTVSKKPVKKFPFVQDEPPGDNIPAAEISDPVTDVQESEQTQNVILEKIEQTKVVANEDTPAEIPKGNEVEKQLYETETITEHQTTQTEGTGSVNPNEGNQPSDPAKKPTSVNRDGTPRKPGSGRPKKQPVGTEYRNDVPPVKNVDLIKAALEGSVMPLVAKKFHKEYSDLLYSKEQSEALTALQPETELFSKPSWPGYIVAAVMFGTSNFMKAHDDKETIERKKLEAELKKQGEKLNDLRNEFTQSRNTNPGGLQN